MFYFLVFFVLSFFTFWIFPAFFVFSKFSIFIFYHFFLFSIFFIFLFFHFFHFPDFFAISRFDFVAAGWSGRASGSCLATTTSPPRRRRPPRWGRWPPSSATATSTPTPTTTTSRCCGCASPSPSRRTYGRSVCRMVSWCDAAVSSVTDIATRSFLPYRQCAAAAAQFPALPTAVSKLYFIYLK